MGLMAVMHFAIGKKTFPEEWIQMDNHFFTNGNKWAGEFPDGFGDAEEELLEGDYDEEEDAE